MPPPTKPAVPVPALRSDPATFAARAEANIGFFQTLVNYLDSSSSYIDAQLLSVMNAVNLGTIVPSLPNAGKLIRLNANGDGFEFIENGRVGNAVLHFGATPPAGTLVCNGGTVSRTTYQELYAAIGDVWGAGDGSSTFNLPPADGHHLEAVLAASVGTIFPQSIQSHTHTDDIALSAHNESFSFVVREAEDGDDIVHEANNVNFTSDGTNRPGLAEGTSREGTQVSLNINHTHAKTGGVLAAGGAVTRSNSLGILLCIRYQ